MVRVHPTRLMREGEVALWRGGTIVWKGFVGARVEGHDFDAMSMNVKDADRLAASKAPMTKEEVLEALAGWWS
jgi:hypothetical protein